ncbi:MAG TPA: ABC transporter permease [Candidatus Sulfotelmatobacter sp.]|nr:ABC transporter permease [Candidatus Sulfotelmatobacter sp.]
MTGLLNDIRYGIRQLGKNRGFAAVAVVTLALGMAANTVIFTVTNATILKKLPFRDPDRLVLVWETFGRNSSNFNIVSAPNYWDIAKQNHVFENIAIFDSAGRGYNLAPTGESREPEQVSGLRVSSTFFDVLGVQPFLGRNFLPQEEELGKSRVVILSYGLWKRRYDADRSLVGKTIRMDGEDFTVVGVMPPDFRWQFWSGPRQLWVPVGYTETDKGRDDNSFVSCARLKPGVTLAQARSEMAAIGTDLSGQYPNDLPNMSATVQPMAEADMSDVRTTMLALFAAVGFVLLIACVNVANLLLARGAVRQKEFALRRALGAGGVRIVRQLLTESVLLALLGGVLGLLLAWWTTSALPSVLPGSLLFLPLRDLASLPIDGQVFGFAFVVSLLTGIIFGLIPAISTIRGEIGSPLQEAGRGASGARSHLRHALVASEVALALVVLCGAGLMIASLSRVLGVDPGLDPKNVITMQMSLPQAIIYNGPPDHPLFCRNMDEHVSAVPGVVAAGAVAHLPFQGDAGRGFVVEGRPDPGPQNMPGAAYSVVCPNYFRTLGVPTLEGREFTHQDSIGAPGVIVINQAMAHTYWPNENPVGRAIRLGGPNGPRLTVVGVVKDVHNWGLDENVHPQFFRPYPQAGWPVMSVVVRTKGAPASYAPAIKAALAEVEPERPVSQVALMQDVVNGSVGSRRFPTFLLGGFAALALALAAVGIIGVVSYSVTQRTREIGIRMALGAGRTDVLKLILSGSMVWVAVGIALGIMASLGLTRLLGTLLYGVKPGNPLVLGSVSFVLTAVALLASYIPARRAVKVDPMVALRYE